MFCLAVPRALAQDTAASGETTEEVPPTGEPNAGSQAGPSPPDQSQIDAAERAKAEFARGNEAYETGRYREAGEAFEQAHAFSPHSAVLFNAARAWWKLGELERAADDYAEAIRRGELTSEQTLRARTSLSRLREKLGWVTIRGQQGARVTVGYHQDVELPLATHLTPGDHLLEVQHQGKAWSQLLSVEANAPLSVVAHPDKQENEKAGPAEPLPPPAPDRSSGRKRQKAFGWTSIGLGAALGAGAAVTGVFTVRSRDRFDQLNDGTRENIHAAEAQRDEAYTLRLATNVLALSSAALGVTGLTLLLTLPGKGSRSRTSTRSHKPALSIRPNQIELSGHF